MDLVALFSSDSVTQLFLLFVIWSIISVISKLFKTKEKYGITVYPLIFIYESERFNKFIEERAKSRPRFWEYYSRVSGPLSLALIFISLMYFAINFVLLVNRSMFVTGTGIAAGAPVVPIIPFVTIPINLFLALIIGSSIAIIPHEVAHGIIAAREGIPIKSSGIYIIGGIIFGGFVKLDEEVEKRLEDIFSEDNSSSEVVVGDLVDFSRKIYKIASAGLLINLLLFAAIYGFTYTTFTQDGVMIIGMDEEGPAYKAGLRPNDVIKGIDGYIIKNIRDLRFALSQFKPNETVDIHTDRGVFYVKLGSHPNNSSRAYLGVYLRDFYNFTLMKLDKNLVNNLFLVLTVSYLLQITVVFLNALPLYVTDGSKVLLFYMLSRKFKLDVALKVFKIVNAIGLTILLANLAISMGFFI